VSETESKNGYIIDLVKYWCDIKQGTPL